MHVARIHLMSADRMRESALHGLGRAGGIGVAGGLLVSLLMRWFDPAPNAAVSGGMGLALLGAAAPVFAAGLLEDFTQRVSKEARLGAAIASAALAGWLLDAWIARVDVPIFDAVIAVPVISVLLTCLLVAGLTNAFNIIDGFNGLGSNPINPCRFTLTLTR